MATERYHRGVVYLLVVLLALPVLGTLIYSLSERWDATVLPHGLTLHWYTTLWLDDRFLMAFWHSLVVCLGTLLLSTILIVPAVFAIHYYFPRLDRWMNILILLPFAVPPVVSSVGLLSLYADGPISLVGTPWILLGCYFTIALPFMYRMLSDSLRVINVRELVDAAHLLGASTPRAFWAVILPGLRKGLLASLFISFSFLFGEFVFANMLVGTRYETLQVYLYNMRNASGHFTSALVMSYFIFTFALTWMAMRISRQERT
ncbi:MAG: ABC transporter permease subunit [Sideroxydans sp.]|nr:ABC transporter permease subunit [Sideroxydans sp.]